MSKVIIISAPSGCGKSTIIGAILDKGVIDMRFSVSATNRQPRQGETNGVHYNFMSTEEFRHHIDAGDFVEHEEVYPSRYYGTLRSEIERILDSGHNCILDIDVKGALNVKKIYRDRAISIFIEPPSISELRRRLESRATDSRDEIDRRIAKAEQEIAFAPKFDTIIVNDSLPQAIASVENTITDFLKRS